MPTTSASGTLAPIARAPSESGKVSPGSRTDLKPYIRLDLSAGYLTGTPLTVTASASGGKAGDELSLWGLRNDGSGAWSQVGRSMRANGADGSFADLVCSYPAGMFASFMLRMDVFQLADAERAASSVSASITAVQ